MPDAPSAGAGTTPLASRLITDVDTLKALADPVRLRILEAMVGASDEAWTVKRIAQALGVGPTKLYHHIRILEERDLIRAAGQQLVRGIVETSYRIGQLELRLDRTFLAAGDEEVLATTHAAFMTLFDLARQDLQLAIAEGLVSGDLTDDAHRTFMLSRSQLRLTRDRAVELRAKLVELFHEYDEHARPTGEPAGDDLITFGLLLSLHPMAGPASPTRTHRNPES